MQVLSNDKDFESDTLSASLNSGPTNGTVTALPVYGDLTVDGTVLTAGGTFTQGDVDGGLVGFTSTTTDLGHATMDGVTFTVTDGTNTTTAASLSIDINQTPGLVFGDGTAGGSAVSFSDSGQDLRVQHE